MHHAAKCFVFAALLSSPLRAVEPLSEEKLTQKIDELLEARWRAEKISPARRADDAEYLRRIYLDLVGRIPTLQEVRTFLNDKTPDKRVRLVRRLLEDRAHVEHFVHVWRDLLVPEAAVNNEVQAQLVNFDEWLRKQFADNVPYDRMVRELLTVPFGSERVRPGRMMPRKETPTAAPSPLAFYLAKDAKPENLAAATSRLFLGVRIECAQCHDHPFGSWTRRHFWSYAAFFAGLQRASAEDGGGIREVFDRRDIKIPGGGSAEARFLDDGEPQWKYNVGARATLADWLTAADNPYFARATVNRVWAYFFGRGFVEPVDDFRDHNRPLLPELLEELSRQFVAHRFDLRFLVRSILASRAYQLTSAASSSEENVELFAQRAVKGLSAEQLFDSLATATGYRPPPAVDPAKRTEPSRDVRTEFLARFGGGQPGIEAHRSIPQALLLMNGGFIAQATRLQAGVFLTRLADDASLDEMGKIETIFLATLARTPTPAEARRFTRYVKDGGPRREGKQALADVFWVLLNCAEFSLNH